MDSKAFDIEFRPMDLSLRNLIALLLLLGTPFFLAEIYAWFALPRSYGGIRNEQLQPKDRRHFELWRWREYKVLGESPSQEAGSEERGGKKYMEEFLGGCGGWERAKDGNAGCRPLGTVQLRSKSRNLISLRLEQSYASPGVFSAQCVLHSTTSGGTYRGVGE
ncbi:hypothetical protein M011DRAFT_508981 [Sporormia fimetaria CBS 119925]|uniref:Uncharacterized protein n=1 Tax=Sporormia fimetaria CBS 119925 TaxID=1340428 RepID=A0A6A6V2T8_9PLEO|nr:hypothetical protein M011DRAFT_508981 [Sporormia fimetaria CBS 119925]